MTRKRNGLPKVTPNHHAPMFRAISFITPGGGSNLRVQAFPPCCPNAEWTFARNLITASGSLLHLCSTSLTSLRLWKEGGMSNIELSMNLALTSSLLIIPTVKLLSSDPASLRVFTTTCPYSRTPSAGSNFRTIT